jgi:hypothetical protein
MPGTIVPEPATPTALAVRWPVYGDKNENATIAVAFRPAGTSAWLPALPLFRTHNESLSPENRVPSGHLFAGSIVDLAPDSAYEIKLTLHDPDGGAAQRIMGMRTAAPLREPAPLRQLHVVPLEAGGAPGGRGTADDPFRGLGAAAAAAQPGDLVMLRPGIYVEAPIVFAHSGTPEHPIVIRGTADGSVVLDGAGTAALIDLRRREHIRLDRLTLRNAGILVQADGASHIAATRSRFLVQRLGFVAHGATYSESVGFRISDNVFVGTTRWPRAHGIEEVYAVNVPGAEHVVSYNLIQNVGDGVHNGDEGRMSASDIHNNDIDVCTDDGIEIDYSDTNMRVFRNRITNCFAGISAQPVHGGPAYLFRNLFLNLQYSPFKLHNDTAGVLLFHNTSVTSGYPFSISPGNETVSDVVSRNNLFVGRRAPALRSTGRMIRCDFDNDGYDWPGNTFALWNGDRFLSASAASASGLLYAKRGAWIMGPRRTFAGPVAAPPGYEQRLEPSSNDPRLARGSAALDRGVPLPNFNDRFTGSAPDLGCCELGEELPHFGPRAEELAR